MKSQHVLFSGVNEMLSADALSDLLGLSVANVSVEPFQTEGYSGSHLSRVTVDGELTLVLKHIRPKHDWHMITTNDRLCRSVTLYQYGILDRLQPHIDHAIVACSKDSDGWGILMHDVSAGLHPLGRPLTAAQIETSLTILAKMHAQFWNADDITAPELSLCGAADLINTQLPTSIAHHPDYNGIVPHMIATGWAILERRLPPDVMRTLEQLSADTSPLIDALARYPYTLLHGDFRTRNLSYRSDGKLVLLDWQMSTRSLMTIDLCWFVDKTDFQLSGYPIEKAVAHYRNALIHELGDRLNLADWVAMLDLGFLTHSLLMATITAWYSEHATEQKKQTRMSGNISTYAEWIRQGVTRF